jgi:hypothetical protein
VFCLQFRPDESKLTFIGFWVTVTLSCIERKLCIPAAETVATKIVARRIEMVFLCGAIVYNLV